MRTIFIAAFLAAILSVSSAFGAGNSDFEQWGLLSIQDGGRRKPMDTFAKETLLRLSGKSSYTATDKHVFDYNEFVLSMLLTPRDWSKEPLILVGYRPLVEQLGLDPAKKRFSFEELSSLPALESLVRDASQAHQQEKELTRTQKEAENISGRLTLFANLRSGQSLLIVPPPTNPNGRWLLPTEIENTYPNGQSNGAIEHLGSLIQAYQSGDTFNLNLQASQLRASLRTLSPQIYPSEARLKLEYFYNHLDPFGWAMIFYALALVGFSIAKAPKIPRWICSVALLTALAGVLFHAGGIALRCIIAGRPPVTNMYESVVWVSFGVMAFGFAFFARYRALAYLIASLPVSLLCLLVLRQLPVAMPENIDPLVPVLRSNFWLTIHVLTITLSYAAFALAMGFGHIVLFRYIRDPRGTREDSTLHFWLYRVLQLGVLLLACGTILGGVWANYSWGRFWGWDPKETWALIALLCYIFVLHGRIVGWWNQFGLAVASVLCFCAVMMTWYGVNFILGKGLHSYGFGIGGESYVAGFVAVDVFYVAVACFRYLKNRPVESFEDLAAEEPLLDA
jgi:cytochrome c-type biogenesis protein CcsB